MPPHPVYIAISTGCTGEELATCTRTHEPDASVVNRKMVIFPEPLNPVPEQFAALPDVGEIVKFLLTVSSVKTCGLVQLAPCG